MARAGPDNVRVNWSLIVQTDITGGKLTPELKGNQGIR
jgi:hypothetical protein